MKDVIYITIIFTVICTISVLLSWVTPLSYWALVFLFTMTWYGIETLKKYLLNK